MFEEKWKLVENKRHSAVNHFLIKMFKAVFVLALAAVAFGKS
jgi:hypothetical protein